MMYVVGVLPDKCEWSMIPVKFRRVISAMVESVRSLNARSKPYAHIGEKLAVDFLTMGLLCAVTVTIMPLYPLWGIVTIVSVVSLQALYRSFSRQARRNEYERGWRDGVDQVDRAAAKLAKELSD